MRQFVADAGHQLRTPLTVIMGNMSVLCTEDCPDEGTREVYTVMLHESRRMRAIIDKLILLARLEHVDRDKASVFNLADTVTSAVTSIQSLAPGSLVVSIEQRPWVRGNSVDVKEALINVLENAVKYGGAGNVRVQVSLRNGEARVIVKDQGNGIPAEDLKRIFDRFYRGSNVEGITGTGLGLTIAKSAIERAEGRIQIESTLHQGTEVSLTFPSARPSA